MSSKHLEMSTTDAHLVWGQQIRRSDRPRHESEKNFYRNEDSEQPSQTPAKVGLQTACPGLDTCSEKAGEDLTGCLEAGGDGGREQEMQQRTASTWPGMARLLQLRATGISSAGEDVEKLKLKVFQVGMLRW